MSIHSDHFLSKDLKSLSVTGTVFAPGFFDHINGRPTLENIYPALRKRMVKIFRIDQLELQVNNKHELNQLRCDSNRILKLVAMKFFPVLSVAATIKQQGEETGKVSVGADLLKQVSVGFGVFGRVLLHLGSE